MTASLAIIGGSAAWTLLQQDAIPVLETVAVSTPFGLVPAIHRVRAPGGVEAWFLSRHGENRYAVSAPFVNYRANVYALKELGVERILSWSGPGSLHPDRLQPGEFVLPADLIDETRNRPATFFQGKGWGFIRSNPVFCPEGQEAFRQAAGQLRAGGDWLPPVAEGAVYVCTEGPRLETPAEIRKYARLGGDLVGMTLAPEVFLARELELCYTPLCYVTNFAEGIVNRPHRPDELFGGMLTPAEKERVDRCVALFPALFGQALVALSARPRRCPCPHAMLRYRREGILSDDWHTWLSQDGK